MEYDLKMRDLKLEEKQKELDQALRERDDFKVKLEKWSNAAVLQNEVLNKQRYLSDKTCIGFGVFEIPQTKGFHSVPPPTGTIIPPRANVSFTGIDELAIRNKVLNQENTKSSQPEIDRNKVIIEDWVDSDDEETDFSEIQKKTVFNSENSETSFENRSPSSQNSVGQGSRKTGVGHKGGKLCFVCYSPNHLIKDCNLHERTFKQTQTHKPKGTQGSRDTRPVWNNINRVNHSNFSRNSRYPHQRKSFIPSAVLTREGLKSTAKPKLTRTVPLKSTANMFCQGTARPKVPYAVLSQSTGRPYYPRMDNTRPRTSSFSPSSRSSTTRTPHRPQRPKKIIKSIWVKKGSTVGSQAVLPQNVRVKGVAMINPKQTWRPKGNYLDSVNRDNGSYTLKQFEYGNPEEDLKDYAIIDSGCSGSMTGDKDKLSDFKEFKGGYVAFGNDSKGGRISGKGTIKTSCIDFEKVSYVEELKFNLLSVSQICDKKHNVLFTDKECLILSPKFKFVDEDLVILRAPRKNDVYSLDLKNIIPSGGITCLVAKATKDEAVLWHRRLGHVNFKNINKLVKGNLVRGLPSKTFKLEHSCLACRKGKQHRASCKKIEERTVREPLELLHMDLFGPVSVESVNRKKYCLVVTDDCSKFSWVFFLAYKDETYDMLHDLIVGLENKLRHKVKTIRCDHGTEFKNHLMNEFCAKKGIKREYSIARTPQQNGVAERKNRTLIEAARTMLADSLLPIQFWAEAVNTACYVLNRVLVTKPQMKTPYEILMGRSPNISFMRPFGCPLTILNTLDQLGKFDGKSDEGYLLGYSTSSKGFRVYNRVTRKVQDCLHVDFLENQENQKGKGLDWMFDLELLTPSMNYIPVRKENYADSGGKVSTYDEVEDLDHQQFIVHVPSINAAQNKHLEERTADKEVPFSSEEQALHDELVNLMHQESIAKVHTDAQRNAFEEEKRRIALEKGKENANSTLTLSTSNTPFPSAGITPTDFDDDVPKDGVFSINSFDDENTDNEEDGAPDYNNMDHTINVSSTPTLRIHKNHPQSQILGKKLTTKINQTSPCFLVSIPKEPKKVSQALADESWVEAMQEELLQFKLQDVWVLCDLPEGKRVIGTKWVFRKTKRDKECLQLSRQSNDWLHKWYQGTKRKVWIMMTMPGTTMIEDQLQEDVPNIVAAVSVECSRYYGCKINSVIMINFHESLKSIIDNESTICIVRNPVFHSKTKHIQIRHHFIRDCYEQRLINVVKPTVEVLDHDYFTALVPKSTLPGSNLAPTSASALSSNSLAAEEEHSTILILRLRVLCKVLLQGTPTQSAAQAGTAASLGTALYQGKLCEAPRANPFQAKPDIIIKLRAQAQVNYPNLCTASEEEVPSSPLRPIQAMESEEQLKVAEVLVAISRPRGLSIPGSIQTQPQQSSQGTDPKDKGKGILIQAEWDAEEERKRFEELKKAKPKTTLRVKPTSLAQERNKMMNFLKGQGYKNLQKLKYPQMKELYDKVARIELKDSYKSLF
ncbi:putative ribonuclease H-like domain-containing protein [Tanacetum coccineum]